ncbi:MAG: signal peptidase I [Bacteroidota bacterium]|nr:signal peptidase I [Bacteroidota bacterium]
MKEYKILIFFIFIIILLRLFVAEIFIVSGRSMDFTLHDNERVIGLKQFNIDRFDVVVMDSHKDKLYVKRVIGLPGDKIEYKNDELYVNDILIEEPYLDEHKENSIEKITEDFIVKKIPNNKYFVMGDNRTNSLDSRKIGFIDKEDILMEAVYIVWPLDKIGIVD